MSFQAKNILLTGGAGFIGCNHVRLLLEKNPDIRIVNLDSLSYAGTKNNLDDLADISRHQFVQGDICDRELVSKLLHENTIDTIIHFAAESHVDRSISGPEVFIQSNVMGTFALLEAARKYWLEEKKLTNTQCRFHHISTDEVYGSLDKNQAAFTEATAYAPNSPYSASKAGADHLVRAYFHTYGLPVTTTNCSNNYGPYQHREKFIPTIIRSCLKEQAIPIYGDGSNIRDWLYVEDHCTGIDAVIRHGQLGETYNIGGCNEWTNIDIVKEICHILDDIKPRAAGKYTDLMSFVTDRPGHDWRYAIDNSKIDNELHWQPSVTFEQGIRKTIAWYLHEA